MKQSIHYFPRMVSSTQSTFNLDLYNESIDLFEEQKYLEAFHKFLDSVNSEFRHKYGNANGLEFHIPHGSIVVDIYLTDHKVQIHSDFMELPEKGFIPMLRQVATININELLLPTFCLEDNKLSINYECKITQTHPSKLYSVFQTICYIGDEYDDEFATKFNASRLYTPKVTPYEDKDIQYVYDSIQSICGNALSAVKEYNTERRETYSWNMISIAIYQISYLATPQGQLSNEIEKILEDLEKDLPVHDLISKGCTFLEHLMQTSKADLAKNLYYVDTFISTRSRSSLKNIQDKFEEVYEKAASLMGKGSYEGATIIMLFRIYQMYIYVDVQKDIHQVMTQTLLEASDKSWEEAANILYKGFTAIEEGDLENFETTYTPNEIDNEALDNPGNAEILKKFQDNMAELQKKMMEAMAKGDMQEYLKIVAEMQQRASNL